MYVFFQLSLIAAFILQDTEYQLDGIFNQLDSKNSKI